MANLLSKARRSAILRRAKAAALASVTSPTEAAGLPFADLDADLLAEQEITPAPVSVALAVSRSVSVASQRVPATRPWSKRRLVLGFVLAALSGLAIENATAPRLAAVAAAPPRTTLAEIVSAPATPAPAPAPAPAAQEAHPVADTAARPASAIEEGRADAAIEHDGYARIPGGVVFVPRSFSSKDGAYDLYVHFHGNARVVLESAEYAGLDAIVAVVNVGVNSAPYLDAYETPGSFGRTLASIGRAVAERGLESPKLRRIAIGSWSGGYGAVSRILDREPEGVDAVLVLDGIHCGWLDDDKKNLNWLVISPFIGGAKRAASGDILFSITHSEIDPIAYAGSQVTAGFLLDAVHGAAGDAQPAPEHVQLKAAEGAVSKKLEKRMEPLTEGSVGSFHVRGYRGNTPEHHMAHLFQMGATVLPELVARWRSR